MWTALELATGMLSHQVWGGVINNLTFLATFSLSCALMRRDCYVLLSAVG